MSCFIYLCVCFTLRQRKREKEKANTMLGGWRSEGGAGRRWGRGRSGIKIMKKNCFYKNLKGNSKEVLRTFLAINTLTVSREGSLLGAPWCTDLIDYYALELNRGSPVHWRQRLSQAQASPLVAMRIISPPEMQALGNTYHHCLLKATFSFVFWGSSGTSAERVQPSS